MQAIPAMRVRSDKGYATTQNEKSRRPKAPALIEMF